MEKFFIWKVETDLDDLCVMAPPGLYVQFHSCCYLWYVGRIAKVAGRESISTQVRGGPSASSCTLVPRVALSPSKSRSIGLLTLYSVLYLTYLTLRAVLYSRLTLP